MKFNTETERMQHPLASMIPLEIWRDYDLFQRELSDSCAILMQTEEGLLKKTCHDMASKRNDDCMKKSAWAAISLSHPHLNGEALYEIGLELHLTHQHLFVLATKLGNISFLNFLASKVPSEFQSMIAANDYEGFRRAAINGHLDVLKYLESKAPSEFQSMIAANDYEAFGRAASKGHLDILNYLESKAPSELQNMIAAIDYQAFRVAAGNGHLDVLKYLESKVRTQFQNMIVKYNYQVFGFAAILSYLESKFPSQLQSMIAAKDYEAFSSAALNGDLDILNYLASKAPSELQNMIAANDYQAFRVAAKEGHLDVLNYLASKAPGQLQSMITADDYAVFPFVAEEGHLDVLKYLEREAPGQLQKMIAAHNYGAFRFAAKNGRLDILNYLESKAPGQLQEMIAANQYEAFRVAAQNGRLDILNYLESKAPGQLQEMIAANQYEAFCFAAQNGRLDILNYLESKAPGQIQEMIATHNYQAFNSAARNRHLPVIEHLLSFTTVFAHAEAHAREYGENYVNPFFVQLKARLLARKEAVESVNSHAIFDIESPDEANLLFYVLRHLIRRNDPALRDDILFILEIPRVKALAHQAVSPEHPNELLRLALTLGNQTAAALLMNITAVRELAEQNNYYRDERQRGLDLAEMVRDRESSMTALSEGERARLAALITRYQPAIKASGAGNLLQQLRETLKVRYERHPASISIQQGHESSKFELPFDWSSFQALHLEPPLYQDALKAYYQHKDHTAYRYLSKPNPWMHQQASYVYINPDNHTEKWAAFEEYKTEISLFYLAAIDTTDTPIDGYTPETRLEHFIDELALIGRAHNWDGSRQRLDASGHVINVECDDLDADRPSCYSGVKRRLFQSVQGHALLTLLTKDALDLEISDFVNSHFKDTLDACSQQHRTEIQNAWDKSILGEPLTDQEWAYLKLLDVSLKKQQEFKIILTTKYGPSFSSDISFSNQIDQAFAFKQKQDAHLLNFGHLHPERLFEVDDAKKSTAAGPSAFFSEPPESNEKFEPDGPPVNRG